ncbi:DNA polymerase-4 [Naumannella cuiyingiana]|uniref:DNA polymerase IV n=1 Tax=Naumannella cuiyingiana TaxID=1347891 RepID=A0A7Z0IL59_9ACTN|nr:DNA polymerase IV [Naumannella cuiyingiana]NYI71299.1 DNA polymerase-4 [Naumannella cuiyingiana]
MRSEASIMHLDLDAFFASVEQRDKPSLRGKPVIVGGLGRRGVVSTASYEARVFGVHSAMPMHEARRLAPHAAFLSGRFGKYRATSAIVMGILREISPLVEPLSLDEAFVDLAAGADPPEFAPPALTRFGIELKQRVREATGGIVASLGIGSSKFIAKLATELGKPDGCHLVEPGTEVETIAPLAVGVIPGVGPVTRDKLARLGVRTVADLQQRSLAELNRELGQAHGTGLHHLAFARDDRAVDPERESKSISVEDTFETDIADRAELRRIAERHARLVARRVGEQGLFARTVAIKVRRPDFSTVTRARTLRGATDRAEVIIGQAHALLDGLDLADGVRLLGVGVSGFSESAQEELFDLGTPTAGAEPEATQQTDWADPEPRRAPSLRPGADVRHREHGDGWVWGAGLGRVTVRFETALTGPGPVRTFAEDDPDLELLPD